MPNSDSYDILVLGSGEAGKYLAWTLAKEGNRTAVIERKMIGGSCPNIACLPSKNEIHSAKVVSYFERSKEFGIQSNWTVDMAGVRSRKRAMVDGLVQMHLERFRESGAELIMGSAVFIGPKTVRVSLTDGGIREIHGEKVFLNLGSRAAIPAIAGLRESKPLSHIEALELDRLPEHLIVLGGGYVGLELAQAFRRFGGRVTILEHGPQLLANADPDIAEALSQMLAAEGIEVRLQAQLVQVRGSSGSGLTLELNVGRTQLEIAGTDILVAAGREPNTSDIGLDKGGVQLDKRGYVRVDETLRTTASDVWAMGDCAGSPQFTHVAFDDFRIVYETLAGRRRTTTGRLIPSCLFTDPQLAHVGLNEREATERRIPYRLAKLPMEAVLRTRTLSETRGFMKALVGEDDRILGFTAFGVEAGELMAAVQIAMLAGQPYTILRDAILTHPTTAEGLMFLFRTVPARGRLVASPLG
jgi:pyruvate/2-oxoglutarate dehydrogenase complex dihydrolipoamide dehydrogenase (E3) component